jgi:hypothetical protein
MQISFNFDPRGGFVDNGESVGPELRVCRCIYLSYLLIYEKKNGESG